MPGGLLITVLLSARLINSLFEKQYALISRVVPGVMMPSTLMILPTSFESVVSALLAVVCFTIGFSLARWMDFKSVHISADTTGVCGKG